MSAWFGGNTILIYLAGLQEVPAELIEAAELDGANPIPLRQFMSIVG